MTTVFEIGYGDRVVTEIKIESLVVTLPEDYFIPDFASNEAALLAGLEQGDLWRDPDRQIRVVLSDEDANQMPFVMDLSKIFSYLRRLF